MPIYNVLTYWVRSAPLAAARRGKIFRKSTFKIISFEYKNLAINAVKWHPSPPAVAFPLACRGEEFFLINL